MRPRLKTTDGQVDHVHDLGENLLLIARHGPHPSSSALQSAPARPPTKALTLQRHRAAIPGSAREVSTRGRYRFAIDGTLLRIAGVALAVAVLAACGSTTVTQTTTVTTSTAATSTAVTSAAATSVASTSTAANVAPTSSSTVTFTDLPDSTQIQANVTVTHDCGSEPSCYWFPEASQYPAAVKCPAVFDTSALIWSGPSQTHAGTVRSRFAFQPLQNVSRVEVCVYANDGIYGDQLAP